MPTKLRSRLELWDKPHPAILYVVPNNDEIEALQKRIWEKAKDDGKPWATFTNWGLIETAKELIYDKVDGKPVFHVIVYALDSEHFELTILPLFDIEIGSTDSVVSTLAAAKSLDVPVYPNTPDLASELVEYHRELLTHGFTAPGQSGEPVRLRLTKGPYTADGIKMIQQMESGQLLTPAEVILVKNGIQEELARRDEAGRILTLLKNAISELENGLGRRTRNENNLQGCLTRNPILFGPEYRRLIPKHKLGSDFVMDYALERVNGLVDLVEIESSTLKLFTLKGSPTKELVHAEQQILDWLSWIEKNSPYAREKLPMIQRPIGYVIIGRSTNLSGDGRARLAQRNAVLRGTHEILTYDDLLERAKNLLGILQGMN
jgi:DNA-binding transcriptional ArsR family regulator